MSFTLKAVLVLIIGMSCIFLCFTAFLSKRGFRSLFLSALEGLCALFAVNLLGTFTNIELSINWFSLCLSALLGTPGVATMLLLNTI